MERKTVAALYKKEMLDILRDKKTVLMMIVIPLVLYPLLFFGSMYLTSRMLNADTSKSYVIAFTGEAETEELEDFFGENQRAHDYSFLFYVPEAGEETDYEEEMRSGKIDAYVTESISDNRPYYEISYLAAETDSQTAAGMIREMLSDYRDELRSEAFKAQGIDEDAVMNPILYESRDLSTNEENAGYLLGYVLPFLLITSILMGALYPAIDATAGEKERGTLETLLTLPVRNLELITAKFLATSTVAVAAAVLNMLSMSVMGLYFFESMNLVGDELSVDLISYLPAFLIMLLCVIVFAMFASAVCLSACIMAKSFKEAQNYTTPVMIIFMLGGMAAMIPQLTLNSTTALIPVVNIALLIAALFKFHFDLALIGFVLISNIAYTALAVVLMARIFSSENILFGDSAGGIRILESRRNMKKGQVPGMGDVVLLFAAILLIILFAGSLAIVRFGLWGVILEQALIFLATVLYAWYIKTDFTKVFHLERPRLRTIPAAVASWAGCYLLVNLLGILLSMLFPNAADTADSSLLGLWENAPLWLIVLSSALMPAICEECAFRGFLLGALEHRYRAVTAIILCGVLFGIYHLNPLQSLLVGIFGILESYIVYRESSISLSILMHFCNNLTSVLLVYYREMLERYIPFLITEDPSPSEVILMAAAGAVLLLGGLFLLTGRDQRGPERG